MKKLDTLYQEALVPFLIKGTQYQRWNRNGKAGFETWNDGEKNRVKGELLTEKISLPSMWTIETRL